MSQSFTGLPDGIATPDDVMTDMTENSTPEHADHQPDAYQADMLGMAPSPALLEALMQLAKRGMNATTLRAADRTEALEAGWIEHAEDGHACHLTPAGRSAVRRSVALRQNERAAATPAAAERTPEAADIGADPAGNYDGNHELVANHGLVAATTNVAESPLAWLRARRDSNGQPMLSDAQFDAGERLRADLWRAQMTPRVTASWSGIPQSRSERRSAPGSQMADSVVGARKRIEHAFKAVGKDHFDLLFDVCGHLKGLEQVERDAGLPRRAGKFLLQRALTALARHYGLLPPLDVDAAIRHRLRHWGSDDYRPSLGHWERG